MFQPILRVVDDGKATSLQFRDEAKQNAPEEFSSGARPFEKPLIKA